MSSGRLARWSLLLQGYQFEIRYKKGTTNVLADALSYGPPPPINEDDEFLNDHHFIAKINQNTLTENEREEICFEYNDDTEQAYTGTQEQAIFTITNISELQNQCDDVKGLINYLTHRELPDDDRTARRIVFESDQYIVENDTLLNHCKDTLAAYRTVKQ